jgi:hypothetical protein
MTFGLDVNFISSIQKGDLSAAEMQKLGHNADVWPPVCKPNKWTGLGRKAVTFGALIGSSLTSKVDTEEIDILVKEEVIRSGGYGQPPPGVPKEISESGPTSEEFLNYVNAAYEQELDVLDRMIAEASMKKEALAKMKEETKGWAAEKTLMLNRYAKTKEHINFEQLWAEGKDMFEAAFKAQRQHTLFEKPFPPGVPSVQTAIKSIAAMVWFFDNFETLEADADNKEKADTDKEEKEKAV